MMHLYKSRKLLLIVLITLGATACKKKSDTPQEARQSFDRGEGLKYIQIPTGKYFVYKDSATGNQDSVVVTKSMLEQIDVAAYSCGAFCFASHPAYHYERFSLTLTKGSTQVEWLKATTGDIVSYYTTDDKYPINLKDAQSLPIFIYSKSTSVISSMLVEGKMYNDIIESTHTDFNGKVYITYWAKNIGLIKRQFKIGTVNTAVVLVRHG